MNEYTSEHWEPYFDDEKALSVIGKHILVGVTYRNHDEAVVGVEQFHGKIIRANREEGIIIQLNGTDEERWIPPDLSRLESADPGEYILKSTGEVVVDPDLISTWTVYPPNEDSTQAGDVDV